MSRFDAFTFVRTFVRAGDWTWYKYLIRVQRAFDSLYAMQRDWAQFNATHTPPAIICAFNATKKREIQTQTVHSHGKCDSNMIDLLAHFFIALERILFRCDAFQEIESRVLWLDHWLFLSEYLHRAEFSLSTRFLPGKFDFRSHFKLQFELKSSMGSVALTDGQWEEADWSVYLFIDLRTQILNRKRSPVTIIAN